MSDKIDVLICDANLIEHRAVLEGQISDVAHCHWGTDPTAAGSLAALERCPVYVGTKFTSAMTHHAPGLQLVLVGGAGHDGIEKAALPTGVVVANTFNHESSIAEYALATTVLLRRGILQQSVALSKGI